MTTGVWSTGTYPNNALCSKKWWGGDDGKYTGVVSPKLKWNAYYMVHTRQKFSGPLPQNATAYNQVAFYQGPLAPTPGAYYGTFTDPDYTLWLMDSQGSWDLAFASSLFVGDWTAENELKLLSRLLEKIKGHSFHMGVSLAEVDKLSSGIVSTLKNIGFGVADLSAGRFSKFARRFGASPPNYAKVKKLTTADISGRFLEMRYAWLPAIGDAFAASKAFEVISGGPRSVTTAASFSSQRVFKYDVVAGQIGDLRASWPDKIRKVKRKYVFEAYEELSFARQIGLLDPASIIWERIPWSFVVDWFIPVGNYLELIGQIPKLDGRFLRLDSIRSTVNGHASGPGRSNPGGWPFIDSGSFESENFAMSRQIVGSLSVPFPTVKVAGAVQGARVQNAIALTHQIFDSAWVDYKNSRRDSFSNSASTRRLLKALGKL